MKFLLTLLIFFFCTTNAQAQQIPESEWTSETQLWAARMLYGEATWQFQDVQLLYVVKNRWIQRNKTLQKQCKREQKIDCQRVSFLKVMRGYSKAINPRNGRYLRRTKQKEQYERWQTIQKLPWDDYEEWPSIYNKKWKTWRKLVNMWYSGKIPNVCPKASHWGGKKIDTVHQGFVTLDCRNNAGGILPEKKPMVNGMQARVRGRTKFRGKVNAKSVIKEFQNVSYQEN